MFENVTETGEIFKELGEEELSLWSGHCVSCGKKYALGISEKKIYMPTYKCCSLMNSGNFQLDNSEKIRNTPEGNFTVWELFEKKLLSIMSPEQQKLYLNEVKNKGTHA